MMNELRSEARRYEESVDNTVERAERSLVRHGLLGASLAALWFGAAFPLVLSGLGAAHSAADVAVYAACGVIFGLISGGSIGAVFGSRGR
jgi:cytochrome c biogenesis protein CcdA